MRAWPAIVLSLILLSHFLLLHFFQSYATCINHTITLLSQLGGAFLIVYSINSNFRILKQKSIVALLANYFSEFPLKKKSIIIELKGNAKITMKMSGDLTIVRNPQTLEEKISYLQEQISELSQSVAIGTKALNNKIEIQSKEMCAKIDGTLLSFQQLESLLHEIYTVDIQPQLFGVLLMFYSPLIEYFANYK